MYHYVLLCVKALRWSLRISSQATDEKETYTTP